MISITIDHDLDLIDYGTTTRRDKLRVNIHVISYGTGQRLDQSSGRLAALAFHDETQKTKRDISTAKWQFSYGKHTV